MAHSVFGRMECMWIGPCGGKKGEYGLFLETEFLGEKEHAVL